MRKSGSRWGVWGIEVMICEWEKWVLIVLRNEWEVMNGCVEVVFGLLVEGLI